MTDRKKDMIIEGLYVSLLADGTIKKHLSTKARDVYFDDTTIGEELISFSERDYIFMPMHRKGICMIACGSRSKDFTYLAERTCDSNMRCPGSFNDNNCLF